MLLQIKNFRFWMQAKMGERGAALVEYAILLAFVAVVAIAFIGDGSTGLSNKIESIITKIKNVLDYANGKSTVPGSK